MKEKRENGGRARERHRYGTEKVKRWEVNCLIVTQQVKEIELYNLLGHIFILTLGELRVKKRAVF